MGRKEGKKLEKWDDAALNAGIIGNIFKAPEEVEREVIKFNMSIRKQRYRLQMKNTYNPVKLVAYSANYLFSEAMVKFPKINQMALIVYNRV